MKKLYKTLAYGLLSLGALKLVKKASILAYHSFGDNPAFFTVKEETFRKQMEYLHKKGFHVISLRELLEKLRNQEDISNCVSITIDDGYKDNYTIAYPILKKYNFPATIFVITDLIGKTYTNSGGVTLPMLDSSEIKELMNSGIIEIMSHTHTHPKLTKITQKEAEEEISISKIFLEKNFGKKIDLFAYPKGRYTSEVVNYLRVSGWLGAVSVKEGLVSLKSNPYLLERTAVDASVDFVQFRGKLNSTVDRYNKIKNWLLQKKI
ncbi:MAG: hypothetical protein COV59_03745 [Candidatus Magasanikbacteria bacterium CG11_big_fil_rev_8_21_14_0_20_39_34]|uniref:NodB homology domain-containing protein n=1 Tax=Candidatus Magasanikbacteria bacterium CG11_big_fil_rev_8_21_14_0_20_39_34 TaxID=1974653 RepID=A0A2H0N4D8_9BACT|nr:MAG: hypothetical protein COV59_03745 [Candidatus Magasanikbacteria bacterium CG11_big_fil_rev_8_21_14_0_20_39_34]